MRERITAHSEEQKLISSIRRSPRFCHGSQTSAENLAASKPSTRKTQVPGLCFTPRRSSTTRSQKKSDGFSSKDERKTTESKGFTKSSIGSRRSARLDPGTNTDSPHLQKQCVIEKRVTRSSVRGMKNFNSPENECSEISGRDRKTTWVGISGNSAKCSNHSRKTQDDIQDSHYQHVDEKRVTRSSICRNKCVNNLINEFDSEEKVRVSSKDGNTKVGVRFCKQNENNIGAEVTLSSNKPKLVKNASGKKTERHHKLSKLYASKGDAKERGIERGDSDASCGRTPRIVEKRKTYEVEGCGIVQEWSTEQELALRRAYFSAKPTPRFWQKVARMVPGKSAEECFDRVYSDHLTPTQPRLRSRGNMKKPSSVSFSASKLLSPTEPKTRTFKSKRRNTLIAQQTVRHLLQKEQKEGQNHKVDLFAVLEPSVDPFSLNFQEDATFASPEPIRGSGILVRCMDTSSSANKKQHSSLSRSQKAAFVSPPVLKQIKNKALHEKYIDQLHRRNAKRKAESLKNARCITNKDGNKASPLEVKSVQVAKDALIFDAQDAINQFRCLYSNADDNSDDDTRDVDEDEELL